MDNLWAWYRESVAGICVLVVVLAVGCGGSGGEDDEAPETNLRVHGLAQGLSEQGQASALTGAEVEVRTDRNGDGEISGIERYAAETDGEGGYEVEVAGEVGRNLVVTVRAPGYANFHERVRLDELADVELDASLSRTETLECRASVCNTEDRSLQLRDLPPEVSGQGRTFNPVVDTEAFPGDFSDDQGNMLISGVFATIDLQDAEGEPVERLEEPATLKMRFPQDTWSTIRDIEANNDRIDVPLYAFDESIGEWVRDGRAVLVDGEGQPLAESRVGEIQTGDYDGVIYATGEVEHFSYWNVDWPVESHGSIRGEIVDGDGAAAQGGVIDVFGITYTGNSSPQTLPGDGTFCVDVMRSEGDDEDIDANGQAGETHRVAVRARYEGTRYDLGTVEVPVEQSSCGDGDGHDMGTVELTPERELQAEMCETTVEVVDAEGTPREGAMVYGFDNTVPSGMLQEMCFGSGQQECQWWGSTDADGRVEMVMPVVDRFSIWAQADGVNPQAETSIRSGTRAVLGCPEGGATVRLEQGYDFFELAVSASVSTGEIAWQPEVSATWIRVDGAEMFKWWVFESEATLESPVTYGQLPDGAEVVWPFDGSAPAALASGDQVAVSAWRTGETGIFELHTGSTTAE